MAEILRVAFEFTEAELARFNKMLKDSDLAAKQLTEDVKKVGTESDKAFAQAANGINQMVSGVKAFLGLAIVNELKNTVIEASRLAAAGEGIRSAFTNLGGTAKDIQKLSTAVGGTVTNIQLMQKAVKGFQKGVGIDDLAKILELANKQAAATNGSLEQLSDIAINAIGKQSTKGLQALGISIQDVQKNAEKMGFLPALMEQVAKKTKDLGDIANPTADSYDRLAAAQQNLKEAFGNFLNSSEANNFRDYVSEFINGAATGLNNFLDPLQRIRREMTLLEEQSAKLRENSFLDNLIGRSGAKDNKLKELQNQWYALDATRKALVMTQEADAKAREEAAAASKAIKDAEEAELKNLTLLSEKRQEQYELSQKIRAGYEIDLKYLQKSAEELERQSQAMILSGGRTVDDTEGVDALPSEEQARINRIAARNKLLKGLGGLGGLDGQGSEGQRPDEKPEEVTNKMEMDFANMLTSTIQIVDLFNNLGSQDSGANKFISGLLKFAGVLAGLVPGGQPLGAAFSILGGLFNEGGRVGMPIGPNKDTVLAGLTLGEYVVKRESTKRSALLLDAINGGELDDKLFMQLKQSPVVVNVDQKQVVDAIKSMPVTDFYKSGSSLYEFRKTQNARNENRRQRLSI